MLWRMLLGLVGCEPTPTETPVEGTADDSENADFVFAAGADDVDLVPVDSSHGYAMILAAEGLSTDVEPSTATVAVFELDASSEERERAADATFLTEHTGASGARLAGVILESTDRAVAFYGGTAADGTDGLYLFAADTARETVLLDAADAWLPGHHPPLDAGFDYDGDTGPDLAYLDAATVAIACGPVPSGEMSSDACASIAVADEVPVTWMSLEASIDFDGDGLPDLLAGFPLAGDEESGLVQIAEGGVLGARPAEDLLAQISGFEGAVAGTAVGGGDFDHDGHVDLAVGCPGFLGETPGRVAVLNGPITGSRAVEDADATLWPAEDAEGYDGTGAVLDVGDIDGDGAADLALGASGEYSDGRVYLVYGPVTGSGTLTDAEVLSGGWGWGRSVRLGDVDEDGRSDLLIGGNYEAWLFLATSL